MRKFQLNAAGEAQVPWHELLTLDDFDGDEESYFEHLAEQADEYEEIGANLRPLEPHPMSKRYQWGEEDPLYKSDLRIFEQTVALDLDRAKNTPPPSMAIPRDQRALHKGGEDAKRAQVHYERIEFIKDQETKAIRYERMGDYARARDCRQRVEQYQRDIEEHEKTPYSFEIAEQNAALKRGEAELDEMLNWDGEDLAEDFDHVKALVVGHRQISDSEYSYVLTGSGDNLKLSKIHHPNIKAQHLDAKMGEISDENLLLKLSAHGVETRPDPEPEATAKPEATSEPKQSNPTSIEVVKGMFG